MPSAEQPTAPTTERPVAGGRGAAGDETRRRFRGRMQTILAVAGADPKPAERLYREAVTAFGPTSELAFQVEYHLEELHSQRRSVADSYRVWEALHVRAEAALGPHDTTLMSIKALRARYARLVGGGDAADVAVHSYDEEWRRRTAMLGPDAHRTRIAHANLAIALRDRARPGDLPQACRILRAETAHRRAHYGVVHPFTWTAQTVLAQTLVRVAEETGDAAALAEARELAAEVLAARRGRFGPTDPATLRAQLVHAHALVLSGEPTAAGSEIRYVLAACRRVGALLDPGWPEMLLARAELAAEQSGSGWRPGADRPADDGERLSEVLRLARRAVRARRSHYPPDAGPVAEAERLVEDIMRRRDQH
jgi:hypothetical protein